MLSVITKLSKIFGLRSGLTLVLICAGLGASAEGTLHRVAIHVDQDDPQVMNMALNNAQNVAAYYRDKGEEVVIEMVAYGPGLEMLVAEQSPVKDRIAVMGLELPISFAACENTIRAWRPRPARRSLCWTRHMWCHPGSCG